MAGIPKHARWQPAAVHHRIADPGCDPGGDPGQPVPTFQPRAAGQVSNPDLGKKRQYDIIEGIQGRKQVVELEDETHIVPPETGQIGFAGCNQVEAVDRQRSAGGPIDTAQQM